MKFCHHLLTLKPVSVLLLLNPKEDILKNVGNRTVDIAIDFYPSTQPQVFIQYSELTKNKTSTGVNISQQHSSNDFMNYFTSKINTFTDQTVTMQLPAAVSHQIVPRNNSTLSLL